MKKISNFFFLRFSCEEIRFRVFFTRKFLHTRIAPPAFSSHENCVARFFFTREFRRLFFLHTRIPLPDFSSHENSVARFFFTREFRCPFFLHTRIPSPVSHIRILFLLLHGFSVGSPWKFWSTSSGATTQSPTTFALRRHLWLALLSVAGRRLFVLESSLQ